MKEYPLNIIKSSLRGLEKGTDYLKMRSFLPYAFLPMGDNYLPLNRDYKPLGVCAAEWVKYEDYSFLLIPLKYIYLSYTMRVQPGEEFIFLYDDNSIPRNAKNIRIYKSILKEIFRENIGE